MQLFKRFFLISALSMLLFVFGVFADEKVAPTKFPYINDSMIGAINKNPRAIVQFYQQDSELFKKDLGTPFSNLNEDSFKLAFSSIVIYRLISGVFADEKVALTDFTYINNSMIRAIKKNPKAIVHFYQQDSELFKNDLGTSFSKLNEDGFKLAFSSIVAYRTAPYGNFTKSATLKSYLKSPFLNCANYPILTAEYFEMLAPKSKVQFYFTGWNGGAVGNHQQLFSTGTGLPLLLDPTIGLIALATFDQVAAGKPIPISNVVLGYSRSDLNFFANKVETCLLKGLYKPSDLLYFFNGKKQVINQKLSDHWATPQYTQLLKPIAMAHNSQKILTNRVTP